MILENRVNQFFETTCQPNKIRNPNIEIRNKRSHSNPKSKIEIENIVSRAKAWFDKLTTLSKVEGQRPQSDGLRPVIPGESEGTKKDFSRSLP